MLKSANTRSACDPCRAKRIRCLRDRESTTPCARCTHTGTQCVTSAARTPGRPQKQRRLCQTTALSPSTVFPAVVAAEESLVQFNEPQDADILQSGFWAAPGEVDSFVDWPADGHEKQPQSGQAELHGFSGSRNPFDAMIQSAKVPYFDHDLTLEPFIDFDMSLVPLAPAVPHPNIASSLAQFQAGIDRQAAKLDDYYSDLPKVIQRCKEHSASEDVGNPVALLLASAQELNKHVQALSPANQPYDEIQDTVSAETALLVLSSYLALMRLFDLIFHQIHKRIHDTTPELYRSMKVKSVLRVGGIPVLQDMSLKSYATAILDAIYSEMGMLERGLGVPVEYCLSGKPAITQSDRSAGIFSRADRAQLFRSVMAQEDVTSRQNGKLYGNSARDNIRESMAFLDDLKRGWE